MTQEGRGRTTERREESKSLRILILKEGNMALEISQEKKKITQSLQNVIIQIFYRGT